MKVLVFCYASSQWIFFFNLDPSLNSYNLGLKNFSNKNHHIFGIARTSAFIWHIWIPLKKFCNATRRVCVCTVLVLFGPFPQIINGKSVKLAVWAVSLIFFWFHIVCDRYTSDYAHFTFSDHFHEISLHYYITFNDKVVEPRLTLSWPNFGSGGPFEVFKKRKMVRIEFPKFLAWFQTPQTRLRGSKTPRRPRKQKKSKFGFLENDHLTSVEWGQWVNFGIGSKTDFSINLQGMDSLNPEEEVSILKNGRSHASHEISSGVVQ